MTDRILATNKKAFHEFEVMEKYEAGIVLVGTEVKSLRNGKVSLGEGWVSFSNNEAFIQDIHIAHYSHGNINNHLENRMRKLLLKKKEIYKLVTAVEERGYAVVPTKIYLQGQLIKVEIAVARGKKLHDKRQANKSKDADREIARTMRNRG
jgi:SsrA-binding protein